MTSQTPEQASPGRAACEAWWTTAGLASHPEYLGHDGEYRNSQRSWDAAADAAVTAASLQPSVTGVALPGEMERLRAGFDAQGRNLAAARQELDKAREQLATAVLALRRLSLIDEIAGMGQRDDDPELQARCRFAARALEQITEGGSERRVVSAPGASDLVAVGNGPLLDPDCRDGKHASCLGAPCECPVPGVHSTRHEHERSQP